MHIKRIVLLYLVIMRWFAESFASTCLDKTCFILCRESNTSETPCNATQLWHEAVMTLIPSSVNFPVNFKRAVRWMARQLGTKPFNVRYDLVRPTPSERERSHPPTCITPEALSTRRDILTLLPFCKDNTSSIQCTALTSEDDLISGGTVRRDLLMRREWCHVTVSVDPSVIHTIPATRLSAAKEVPSTRHEAAWCFL